MKGKTRNWRATSRRSREQGVHQASRLLSSRFTSIRAKRSLNILLRKPRDKPVSFAYLAVGRARRACVCGKPNVDTMNIERKATSASLSSQRGGVAGSFDSGLDHPFSSTSLRKWDGSESWYRCRDRRWRWEFRSRRTFSVEGGIDRTVAIRWGCSEP